jgi:DNA excision repair protein ERCC-4
MIIADSREPSYIKAIADRVEALPVDFLIVGEYRKYAVERKTTADYWNSVIQGRIWRQLRELERLRDEEGYIPILLVVGNWGKVIKMRNLSIPQYIGAQIALSSFGITPIWVSNKDDSITAIKYMDSKAGQKPSHLRITIPKPITRTVQEERLDVISALRGIGAKTAEEILNEYKSPYKFFTDVMSKTEKVKIMLGEKRLLHAYAVLSGEEE